MEKEKVLLSFIVPVYNVEKYIENCIKSILKQSYDNIEVILVDDGSPDASPKILDEYAKIDQRVKVIHQENAGVSSARNAGLDIANGQYVLFVDADDYIEPDYAKYFLDLALKNNVEIAYGRCCYSLSSSKDVLDTIEIISSAKAMEEIYLGGINVAVWNKIYRRDFLTKNNIRFNPEIWYGEGMLFNIECLQCTDFVAVGKKKLYHQVSNPESAMRKFNLDSVLCGVKSMYLQKEVWKSNMPKVEKAWKFHCWCFATSISAGLIQNNMIDENRELYDKCISALHRYVWLAWLVNIPLGRKLRITLFSIIPKTISKRRAKKNLQSYKRQDCIIDKLEI